MTVLSLLLGLLIGLLLIWLLTGYACFVRAIRRRRRVELDPLKAIARKPRAAFLPQIREGIEWIEAQHTQWISIQSRDGLSLYARLFERENARGTALLFHGYRCCANIDFCCAASDYYHMGFNLLLVDQRAHGRSEGEYLGFGVTERFDCLDWANAMACRFGPDHPLILSGVSMGASTVLMAAALPLPASVRCIVADCGYTSPLDILKKEIKGLPPCLILPMVNFVCRQIAGYSLACCSAFEAVESAEVPIFFLHGAADAFVPPEMTRKNYESCASQKELLIIPGAGHAMSYLVDGPRCRAAVTEFIDRQLTPQARTHS